MQKKKKKNRAKYKEMYNKQPFENRASLKVSNKPRIIEQILNINK